MGRQAKAAGSPPARSASDRKRATPEEISGASVVERRKMLADYLRLLAWWLGRPPTPAMPPRLQQVLTGLLLGRSEKELARETGQSVHTVHEYIKQLHKTFDVASRGELLARFLPQGGALSQPIEKFPPPRRGRPPKAPDPGSPDASSPDA